MTNSNKKRSKIRFCLSKENNKEFGLETFFQAFKQIMLTMIQFSLSFLNIESDFRLPNF